MADVQYFDVALADLVVNSIFADQNTSDFGHNRILNSELRLSRCSPRFRENGFSNTLGRSEIVSGDVLEYFVEIALRSQRKAEPH
jgi:hypothetical protein